MPAPVSTTKRFFFILSVFLYFKISNCLITDITLIKTGFLFHYPTSILQRLRQFPPVSFHLVAYVFPPADHNRKLYIFLREIPDLLTHIGKMAKLFPRHKSWHFLANLKIFKYNFPGSFRDICIKRSSYHYTLLIQILIVHIY